MKNGDLFELTSELLMSVVIESIKTFSLKLMKGEWLKKTAQKFNKDFHKWINEKTVRDWEAYSLVHHQQPFLNLFSR